MGRRTVLIFVLILSFLRSVKTNNAQEILTQIVRRESRKGVQVLINAGTGQVESWYGTRPVVRAAVIALFLDRRIRPPRRQDVLRRPEAQIVHVIGDVGPSVYHSRRDDNNVANLHDDFLHFIGRSST